MRQVRRLGGTLMIVVGIGAIVWAVTVWNLEVGRPGGGKPMPLETAG